MRVSTALIGVAISLLFTCPNHLSSLLQNPYFALSHNSLEAALHLHQHAWTRCVTSTSMSPSLFTNDFKYLNLVNCGTSWPPMTICVSSLSHKPLTSQYRYSILEWLILKSWPSKAARLSSNRAFRPFYSPQLVQYHPQNACTTEHSLELTLTLHQGLHQKKLTSLKDFGVMFKP